jgi:RNA polymerase sigma-70 factor (ECF subfamily)
MPSAPELAERCPPRLRVVAARASDREDDAALVAGVKSGVPRSAALLWDRYSSLVRRVLRRVLGPSAEVEDAVQDVFLRLFRDLDSLRDPSLIRSFLIGIALHVAKTELRKRRARRWLLLSDEGDLPEADVAAPGADYEARRALFRLYRVLDRVSIERRSVFVLRYVEGLELVEISTILGCSVATTKRRVADAARRVCLLAAADPFLAPYVAGSP